MNKTFKTCVVATFMVLFSGNIFQANTQSPLKAVSSRDANGDGKVSSDEWEKPQKAFDRIDKDGDGYLSPEDFAQHWGIELPSAPKATPAGEDDVIIADVHMHPSPDNSPHHVLDWMDRNKVQWAGLGALRGGRSLREHYAEVMGKRYIPFGGQSQLNQIYFQGDNEATEDPNNEDFKDLMTMLEEDFKAGKLKGIGEIFANARTTSPFRGRKMRIDSPTMRAMYNLATKYGGVITVHVQFDSDSIGQLKTLAASNLAGQIIMAHCGSTTTSSEVREMLKAHQNIYCDLSARHPPKMSPGLMRKKPKQKIFTADGLESDWRDLIEEMPDRFMVGTDTKTEADYDGGIAAIRQGLLTNLSPETAEKVAYSNARNLLKLE